MLRTTYRGRFAPSPTGLLHAGSLATALASWLDARAVGGIWLIRVEDLDTPRIDVNATKGILQQLAMMGMTSDETILYQSQRIPFYEEALHQLNTAKLLYTCSCSRKKISEALESNPLTPVADLIYPGLCRPQHPQTLPMTNMQGAIRVRLPMNTHILGQDVLREVGDFVIQRNDGIFTYQLAVVVDDGYQGITDVVRGGDLESNTPRQIWLQQQLGLPQPNYRHIPLVVNESHEKLSKQTKAPPIWPQSTEEALHYLHAAGEHLGLGLEKPSPQMTIAQWQEQAIRAWSNLT
jgi:glutamyl-Q tRNA(Asp) synthetase